MRLLLDTHIALWAIAGDAELSVKGRDLIDDQDNQIVVSTMTVWEILIFRDAGFELLDISPAHAAVVETLPLLHADPFDRMIVAQAMTVPLRLLSRDRRVAA